MNSSKPTLIINLKNIQHNYKKLKKACPNSDIGASVKANAYGLGIHKIAPILLHSGCKHFFVANCDEGIRLRSIIEKDSNIYVFHGVFRNETTDFLQHNLIPVLNHLEQIEIWQESASNLNKTLPCILHIDTGMHRLGLQKNEVMGLDLDFHTKNLDILYVISHLTSAEDIDSTHNKIQLELFNRLSAKFINSAKSLANSSGIFLGPNYHFDLIRAGAAIYGIDPTPYINPTIIKPVVSLFAPIIQINSLLPGESVGYNRTYTNTSKKSCSIATIPVGYADGFLRHFSNKGKVLVGGYEAPIIGRVSMDLTIIDLSKIPNDLIHLGQKVELLGENLTADKIAKLCGTNSYEILTSLDSRYERIYC